MYALIRESFNSRMKHLFIHHAKYSFYKIRKFSQKINTPTNITEPSKKEKDKSYIYKIPPWMKKETERNEDSRREAACERKSESQVEEKSKRNVNVRREDRRNSCSRQQTFQGKSKGNPIKKIKRRLSHSAVLSSGETDKSTRSKYLKPVPRKIDEQCMILDRDHEVNRPILPTFKPKSNDPCGKKPKVEFRQCTKTTDDSEKELSSNVNSEMELKTSQLQENQQIKSDIDAVQCFNKQKDLNKTESLTCTKEKQALESADKPKPKNILQNLTFKLKEKNNEGKQISATAAPHLLVDSSTSLLKKESNNKLNSTNIKVHDLLESDILWAQGKIKEMRHKDSGILNQTNSIANEISNHKDNNKAGKNIKFELPKIDEPSLSFADKRKIERRKFAENKGQIVLKLTSNPLKLNSKETLYVKPEDDINKFKKQKIVKQSTMNAQDRYVQLKKKGIKSNIKSRNQLNSQVYDKTINNNYNKRLKAITADANGKRIKDVNKYLIELKELSNKKRNNKSIHRLQTLAKQKPIFNSKSTKQLNKMDPSNIKKPMSVSSNILGSFENFHKSSSGADQCKPNWQVNVNRQINRVQSKWSKENNNKQNELKMKAKTLLKAAKKKPVFIPTKPSVMKGYPIKQGTVRASKADVKKVKPVFGPPGQCSKQDESAFVAVVNSDTRLADDIKEVRPLCSSDDQQKQLMKKQCDDQCSIEPLKHNDNLIDRIKLILNNYINAMCELCKQMAKTATSINLTRQGNQPKDNLSVSVLVTQKQRQPIYICDSCSYLTKRPTIYQRLNSKLDHFSHLIKTKEAEPVKSVNTITGLSSMITNKCSNDKQSCPSKNETSTKAKVMISCNARQSYSDVLSNLFSSRFQQRSSSSSSSP